MIIELFGLPAVGKTALAEELVKLSDFKLVKIRNLRELFWYNLIFLIRHPLSFGATFLFIAKNSANWSMFYFKFMNCLLQHNAKHQKARRYRKAIIDHGHWQNVISVFEEAISEKQLRQYIKYLPTPEFLAVIEAEDSLMKEREAKRGYFGREDLGSHYQKNWRKIISENCRIFKTVLADNFLNHKIFNSNQSANMIGLEILEVIENDRKKIDYLANIRIPTQMGHGYQIAKTCESLGRAGYDLTLWVPSRKNKITVDPFEYYQIEKKFKIKIIKNIDFLSWPRKLSYLKFLLQRISFLIILFFKKFDLSTVVFTRDIDIAWLMKERGFRVIYECHEWFMRHKSIPIFLLRKADQIISTNIFIRDQFLKNGFKSQQLLVLPNGIDLEKFDLPYSKSEAIKALDLEQKIKIDLADKKVLFYSGSLLLKGKEKGVGDILKALKILNDKNLFFLAVGGDEKDIRYYESLADKLGLLDQVCFLGRQLQTVLALYQKLGDIMLMPFPRLAHYEFFMSPLKTFEYMASGRPIIASDLPSIKEILNEKNCLFCLPDDSTDLAEKIKRLLVDELLGQKLATQARQDAWRYSWNRRAEKIVKIMSVL